MPGPRSDSSTAERPTSASFATRLQGLYSARKLEGRKPYTDPAVAKAVSAVAGKSYSTQYLNQLRRGHKARPAPELVEALAVVFDVNRAYFYDDNTPAQAEQTPSPQLAAEGAPADLSPEALQIGLRADGLSQHWRLAVMEFIEHARNADGLDEADEAR